MPKSLWQTVVDASKKIIGLDVPEETMTEDTNRVYMARITPEVLQSAMNPDNGAQIESVETTPAAGALSLRNSSHMRSMDSSIQAVQDGSPNRHVLPHITGWKITQPGNEMPVELHSKKSDAVASARLMCIEGKGELFIHGKDGKIQNRNSYGNDDPKRRG